MFLHNRAACHTRASHHARDNPVPELQSLHDCEGYTQPSVASLQTSHNKCLLVTALMKSPSPCVYTRHLLMMTLPGCPWTIFSTLCGINGKQALFSTLSYHLRLECHLDGVERGQEKKLTLT